MKMKTKTEIIKAIEIINLFIPIIALFIVLINLYVIKCLILKISVIIICCYVLFYVFGWYNYIVNL